MRMKTDRHTQFFCWTLGLGLALSGCGDEPIEGEGNDGGLGSTGVTAASDETGRMGDDSADDSAGTSGGTDGADDGAATTGGADDGADDDAGPDEVCYAPATYVPCDGEAGAPTSDPFQAIGLGCPGTDQEAIAIDGTSFEYIADQTWAIIAGFGTFEQADGSLLWSPPRPEASPDPDDPPPNGGNNMLMLSTGLIAEPDAQGVVVETTDQELNGDNGNDDTDELPPPLSPMLGSNGGAGGTPFSACDGINDCSDSLYEHWVLNGWNEPNDKIWMGFNLEVPDGTHGFIFDFAYFSSEWPGYIDSQYNDLFIAWSTSETYTGNLTFVNNAPLTITSLHHAGGFAYTEDDPELAGTGFQDNAATGWFSAKGSATPGETLEIVFFLADMGDSSLASAVLLDNFRWDCKGCIPSEVDSCGIQMPDPV